MTFAAERCWRGNLFSGGRMHQSRQSSHQLPFRFSAAARNTSGPAGFTGPIMNDAFEFVGGLSRL